jgi:RNA polymerase sigma factor (sigma-70 family)
MADDVTQAVFLILSRSAGRIKPAALMGWLFTTTRQVASNANKAAARRRYHERRAAELRGAIVMPASDDQAEYLQHHLHRALASQRETDRSIVLMRYVQGLEVIDISKLLGISDSTARKRIERAVERLRETLEQRGIAIGAGSVSSAVGAMASAAPPALVQTIAAGETSAAVLALAKGAGAVAALPLAISAMAALLMIAAGVAAFWPTLWGATPPAAAPLALAMQVSTTAPASSTIVPEQIQYEGTIRDSAGNPAGGVRVWSEMISNASLQKTFEAETRSDAAGHFALPPLPAIPLPNRVNGETLERRIIFDQSDQAIAWKSLRAGIEADASSEKKALSIDLEPSAPLRVEVLDPAGEPIAGAVARVRLQHRNEEKPESGYGYLDWPIEGDIRTGEDGVVTFDRIPQRARAHITVTKPGYATFQTETGYQSVKYPIRPGYGPMMVTLHPGGAVRVRFPQGGGNATLMSISVMATAKSPGTANRYRAGPVGPDGSFILTGLYPGAYDLNVVSPLGQDRPIIWHRIRRVEIKAGETTSVEATAVATQRIRGRLIEQSSQLPLADHGVSLNSSNLEVSPFSRGATTGADGRFEAAVPVGDLTVTVADYTNGQYDVIDKKVTVVAGEDLSLGDIFASKPPTIRGRLVDAAGQPAAGWVQTWFGKYPTAADGSFAIPMARGGIGNTTFISATNREETLGRMLPLEPGMLDPKLAAPGAALPTIALRALAQVHLQVVDRNGKPVNGANVWLSIPSPNGRGILYNSAPWGGLSGDDGRFVIDQLPAGLNGLQLYINKNGEQNIMPLETLRPGEIRNLEQVTIARPADPGEPAPAAEAPPLNFSGTLIGRVVDDRGKPMVGVDVQASVNLPGLQPHFQDCTDHEGRFILQHLPKGQRISITARDPLKRDAAVETMTDAKDVEIRVGGLAADLIGKPAPELAVSQWVNSPPIKLSDLRGKVVLIDMNVEFGDDFDLSGSGALREAQRRHDSSVLAIIAVHASPQRTHDRLSADVIKQRIIDRHLPYPVAIDSPPRSIPAFQGWTGGETSLQYQIFSDHGMVIIDKQGMLRGAVDSTHLDAMIEKLLAE